MSQIRSSTMELKAGDVVKCCHNNAYYIVNKVDKGVVYTDNGVTIDIEDIEINDYCIKHNNPVRRFKT